MRTYFRISPYHDASYCQAHAPGKRLIMENYIGQQE